MARKTKPRPEEEPEDESLEDSDKQLEDMPEWELASKGTNKLKYAFRVVQENLGPNRAMRRFNDKIRRKRRKKYIANIKKMINKEVSSVQQ